MSTFYHRRAAIPHRNPFSKGLPLAQVVKRRISELGGTPNLRTKILDLRGFDSSRILSLRDEMFTPIGNLPESLSQRILVTVELI